MRFLVLLTLAADAGIPSRGLDPYNCGALQVVSALAGDLSAVAFSPDGRLCAVGGAGGIVRLYDAALWRETQEVRLDGRVAGVAFLPDGRLVAAGRRTIRVLPPGGGADSGRFPDLGEDLQSIALSPDGRVLLAAYGDGQLVHWDVPGFKRSSGLPGLSGDVPTAMAFAPGGDRYVRGTAQGAMVHVLAGPTWVGTPVQAWQWGKPSASAFTPDGQAALLGVEGAIVVVDAGKQIPARAITGHGGGVTSVAVTRDSRYLVSASGDGTVRIWDWRKGAELAQLKHEGARAVALHPTGRMFASVGSDRRLRVWGYVRGGSDRPKTKGFCGISFVKRGKTVIVSSLVPGGPAEQAGLKEGDAVRVIGTKAIQEPSEALEAIGSYGDGDEAVFEIERQGEEKQVRVRLGRKPGAKERAP